MMYVSMGQFPGAVGVVGLPPIRGRQYSAEGGLFSAAVFDTDAIGNTTITFTGLPVGTDVVVLDAGTTSILEQVDQHPSADYAFNTPTYATSRYVDVGFIKPGFIPFYIRNLKVPEKPASIPVKLRLDPNYL